MRMNVKIKSALHQTLRMQAFVKKESLQDLIDDILEKHIEGDKNELNTRTY